MLVLYFICQLIWDFEDSVLDLKFARSLLFVSYFEM